MLVDLTPANVPWTCTRGDHTVAVEFTLARDGSPWQVDSALAQVRASRNRSSTLILALTATVAGAVVTVGDGDSLAAVSAGVYYWDLQVTDDSDILTIASGTFQVLDDVSHPVTP
jgi:hypothetical protein